MPPGMWHMVYTPVSGMTSGGHFLSYDIMHLMHLACTFNYLLMPYIQKGFRKPDTPSNSPLPSSTPGNLWQLCNWSAPQDETLSHSGIPTPDASKH